MPWNRAVFATMLLIGAGVGAHASIAASTRSAASITAPSLAALQKQAAAGNAAAEYTLGYRLGVSKNPADNAKAVDWYRKAAAQGNTDAEWALGTVYVFGDPSIGIPQDVPTGLRWMRKSLSDGSADNMAVYGDILAITGSRTGNEQAMREGVEWIRRGATGGSVRGMNILGSFLLTGMMDMPPDRKTAEYWLLKSAKLGSALSQQSLGELYAFGVLGSPDIKAGLHWLRAAARQGDVDAEGVLAYFLITGKNGATRNSAEGVQWARRAIAEHGAGGYYALGLAYQHGQGVALDPAKAWYNFAVAKRIDTEQQLEHVDEHLSEVATRLSVTQIGELEAEASKIHVPTEQQQNGWLKLATGPKSP